MTTADDLQRAYQLIREDRSEEAEALLLPILMEDSENVDAWWLMAYAVEDPNEVREALNRVLELDPNYSQAPKAREMLAQLDAQHPPAPAAEEETAPLFSDEDDLFGDTTIDESFFDTEEETVYEAQPFGEDVDDLIFDDGLDEEFTASLSPPEGMMTADELFGTEEEDIFGTREAEEAEPAPQPEPKTFVMSDIEEPLGTESRAALEEKVGRRQGRRRRWFIMFLFVLIVFVVPAVIIVLLLSGGGEVSDPGPLESLAVESQTVSDVRVAVGSELRLTQSMNDSQVVIAESSFGRTFYAKICAQPGPDFPEKVWQAMDIVARQAPQLEGEMAAVGVSIENCSGSSPDTYYRAAVSLADAARYANNDLGLAQFQALWKES